MRIAWLANAPWAQTGYGVQTRLFVPRIRDLGYDMSIQAFYGLEGGQLSFDNIPVYPRLFHPYGQDIMGAHSKHFGADIMISLMDAWVMQPETLGTTRYCPWYPVDMQPLPPPVAAKVSQAFQPIVYSKFGERMSQAAGLDTRYVPHGCDTKSFKPKSKSVAREQLGWPQDRYIVGMVAANKGTPSRKAFPQNLEAFAQFKKTHPDALLYLHTNQSLHAEMQGVNLPELCMCLGIGDSILFADPYILTLGFNEEHMVNVYNAMDVLLAVSMGEGFGVPILEAQSCGTPVIIGDWTAMPELLFAGWAVAKEDADKWWTPLAAYQFVPRIPAITACLEQAYAHSGSDILAHNAREGAKAYDADRVTEKYWKPVLAEIEESVNATGGELRLVKV